MHTARRSTTLYYKDKACTKHVAVLQSLQSLHKVLPSTTLYYKACIKYFLVLLCTSKLAQNTAQYYFILQRLHKVLTSTTLYYKACTTKLALQSLHKVYTIYFPVLYTWYFKAAFTLGPNYYKPMQCPCNIQAASTMRFTAPRAHPCSHYNAICTRTLQNTVEEPITRRYVHCRLQPLYTRKTQCFVLRLPLQHESHATFMQPLHCVLQQHVHIHAAITMRFASTRCRTPWKNRLRVETTRNRFTQELHRSCPSSPAAATLQCFVPCNIHAAITLRFAATRAHSCSHYNATCIDTLQNTMEEPIARRNDPQPPHTGATQELPFIAGCSHFTRRNTMFRAMQHSCSHYTAFCSNTCTFMQPLQCDLHRHVAEHHGRTDYASRRPATASHRSCP